MRARNIKPGFYKNEQLAECSFEARLLFPGLWMLADRSGRMEYRPKRIKAELFPFDNLDVVKLVGELEKERLVVRYQSGNLQFLWIPGFSKHQAPHIKEKQSELPECPLESTVLEPDEHQESTVLEPDEHPLIPESLILNPDSLNPEVKALCDDLPASGDAERTKAVRKNYFLKEFELFWDAFSDKRGKEPALKSWKRIKGLDADLVACIISGAKEYAIKRPDLIEAKGTPKMAQGWLTDRRWEDEECGPCSRNGKEVVSDKELKSRIYDQKINELLKGENPFIFAEREGLDELRRIQAIATEASTLPNQANP